MNGAPDSIPPEKKTRQARNCSENSTNDFSDDGQQGLDTNSYEMGSSAPWCRDIVFHSKKDLSTPPC